MLLQKESVFYTVAIEIIDKNKANREGAKNSGGKKAGL